MVADRRRERKKLEKHAMKSNLDDFNRKTTAAKEICEKSKKISFQLYVSTLQHDTPIKTVWKKIKLFKSSYMQQTYPLIKSNAMITDPKEKANALAEYFTNNSGTGIHWTPGDAENMIESAKLYQGNEEYNKRIGFSELEEALANASSNSEKPILLLYSCYNNLGPFCMEDWYSSSHTETCQRPR